MMTARPARLLLCVSALAGALTACASDEAATKEDAPMADHDHAHAKGEHQGPPGSHEHHGGHHRFDDAEQWAKRFEDPARDAWQKPEAVLDKLALDENATVADIGSATGYFPVRVAKRVPAGQVWGIDIEPEMVRYLNDRAEKEGLTNLKSVLGTPEDPKIPAQVDLVMMVDTYHHVSDRVAYFKKVAENIKPGGRLAIVDFKMGEIGMGPPDKMKVAPDQIVTEMHEAGFLLELDDRDLLEYQVLLVFRRP